jgi:choline dehydrogenase-like flavoprotein
MKKKGIATPWPIGYDDMAPWYTHVEKFAGLSGSHEDMDVLPDSVYLHAMDLNCVEQTAADRIRKAFDEKAPINHRPHLKHRCSPSRTHGMPIPQQMLAGLSIRRLLQYTSFYPPSCDDDGEFDLTAAQYRKGIDLR